MKMYCFCGSLMEKKEVNKMILYQCLNCNYLKKKYIPTALEEKARYDYHKIDDTYFQYMKQVYQRIEPFLLEGVSLDFGCGKAHTLCDILNKNKRLCDYYDLYYFPKYPNRLYNNIILIEVFEHIEDIYSFLRNLRQKLEKQGRILIMTQPIPKCIVDWWYLRDITHISFVDEKTMTMLASLLGFRLFLDLKGSLFVLERID